jgi:hypothetical protein
MSQSGTAVLRCCGVAVYGHQATRALQLGSMQDAFLSFTNCFSDKRGYLIVESLRTNRKVVMNLWKYVELYEGV